MGDWDVTSTRPIGEWDVVSHEPIPAQPIEAQPTAAQPATPDESMMTRFGKGLARGAEGLVGDLGEAVMGPFGPRKDFQRLMHDVGLSKEEPQMQPGYGQQIAQATGMTSAKPGYAGSIGEVLGNPTTYLGPGGVLAKTAMGAAAGAGGELGSEMAEGTGYEPLARIAGSLAAGPLAARAIKPQLGADQQALADAGVRQMTPGQLQGGWLKGVEDKMTSWPILGDFIQNARGRSIEGFNRAVGNQALEPIGESLAPRTAAGHDTVTEVERKLSNAYDQLVPNLHFVPDYQFAHDYADIMHNSGTMPHSNALQLERILNDRLHPDRWVSQQLLPPNMPNPGNLPVPRSAPIWGLQGRQFKDIESELNNLAGRYGKSSDVGQQQLGEALGDVVRAMRQNIERANPAHAEELSRINQGWAMYARMRDAASRRATSEGVFTPSDLLSAVKRGDRSVGKGSFARGDALMQDFAEAGQRVLPSKVPDSGTAGRAMMAGLLGTAGAGTLAHTLAHPGIAAAGAAAIAPYTRMGQWLANRYTGPGLVPGMNAYAQAARRPLLTTSPIVQSPFTFNGTNPFSQ